MATNMDKAFYQAPMGLEDDDGSPLEIDIVNPEMVTLDDGSVEITIIPEEEDESEGEFSENLAEILPDNVLSSLASDLTGHFETDVNSRKDWIDSFVKGLELLGLNLVHRNGNHIAIATFPYLRGKGRTSYFFHVLPPYRNDSIII